MVVCCLEQREKKLKKLCDKISEGMKLCQYKMLRGQPTGIVCYSRENINLVVMVSDGLSS
jgi:hypothetical protein